MKTEPNESAFPCHQGQDFSVRERGLTKREYFASLAMQSLVNLRGFSYHEAIIAERSIKMADALINELNRDK